MNKIQFLKAFNELLELEPDTIKGDEVLVSINSWDSLAVLGLIALVDQKFGLVLSPTEINNAKTVNDLVGLLGDRVAKD